jgi:glycosyltransferase involved in cell wall biosynthesis
MPESFENHLPFVSVVMPVRNEGAFMTRSLGSVIAQDYPADRLEVLVVDGMSSDGTRDVVAQFVSKFRNVALLDNPAGIVPNGLNIALSKASGEVIVRVDGHCEIATDYVRRAVEHLRAGAGAVGGPLETVGETMMASAIAAGMSSSFGVGGSAFRTVKNKTMVTDTVAFPAYTRNTVELGGPFDEELVRNQDDEYNYRLRKLGVKVLLAADVKARYYSRASIRSLARQYFQYGFWKVRVLQKHPRQMQPRHFVPLAFILSLLVLMILSPFSALAQPALGLVLGTYALANLAASVFTAKKAGWLLLPLLPIVFAVLHFSYGLGFLVGLVRFSHRWLVSPTQASPQVTPMSEALK